MGISFMILFLVLFLVFMFTAEGVSDSAKRISVGIGIISVVVIMFKLF